MCQYVTDNDWILKDSNRIILIRGKRFRYSFQGLFCGSDNVTSVFVHWWGFTVAYCVFKTIDNTCSILFVHALLPNTVSYGGQVNARVPSYVDEVVSFHDNSNEILTPIP